MLFLEDMILSVCVCEAREARRGCPEGVGETRERGREGDEKTSWMNEFGEIPAKQEEGKGKWEKRKRGRQSRKGVQQR